MKGYLVGYFDSWANDCNSIIIGYYTTFKRAVDAVKNAEIDNLNDHKGLRRLYIVEIEVNKAYTIDWAKGEWVNNYTNYTVKTVNGTTVIKGKKAELSFNLDLVKETSEWQTVKRKKSVIS